MDKLTKSVTFLNCYSSFTVTQFYDDIASKIVNFSLYSFLACLIISGSIRLISLMKLSEEAGIQMFGPDNVAIQKVRIIVILTSSILFLVLLHDSGKYETLFNPAIKNGTEIKQVI